MVDAHRAQATYRWVLQYSSVAFALLVLMQSYGVVVGTPRFSTLFAEFGASLPPLTLFALKAYWVGSIVCVATSLASAIYIWFRPGAPERRQKFAYGLALTSLVGAFMWSGFIVVAVYQPIFRMGAAI
jgi:type II secretory pathway component PulF